jgi:hypothetical protein
MEKENIGQGSQMGAWHQDRVADLLSVEINFNFKICITTDTQGNHDTVLFCVSVKVNLSSR